eukprot:1159139-Pelagomonas_calceolata.AAC.2
MLTVSSSQQMGHGTAAAPGCCGTRPRAAPQWHNGSPHLGYRCAPRFGWCLGVGCWGMQATWGRRRRGLQEQSQQGCCACHRCQAAGGPPGLAAVARQDDRAWGMDCEQSVQRAS